MHWPLKDCIYWASVNHILCTVISLNVQLAVACHYCLSNSEFNKVLNLFDEFAA